MTDDRNKAKESYNPPVDPRQSPGEGGDSTVNGPGNNASPSLDTTLDTPRTGGMGGWRERPTGTWRGGQSYRTCEIRSLAEPPGLLPLRHHARQ